MDINTLEQFLFWCMIINLLLMTVSLVLVTAMRPMVVKIHSKMFSVPEDYVDKAIYAFLGVYKLLVFVFVIVPWIVVKFIVG